MTRNIKSMRDALGISTAQLAKLLGVSPRTVARWIDGTRNIPEPTWNLLKFHVMMHIWEGIGFTWENMPEHGPWANPAN